MPESTIGRRVEQTARNLPLRVGALPRRKVLAGMAAGAGALALAAVNVGYGSARADSGTASALVSARSFGAVGDGVVDDTEALQAWFNHVVEQHTQGWLPNGTYRITKTIIAPHGYGWGIRGENKSYAIIKQETDNVPVLQVGDVGGASHSWSLEYLSLHYFKQQPTTNTNAICLLFEGQDPDTSYFARIRGLDFRFGYYSMRTAVGKYNLWGSEFEALYCASMSGGFYDNAGSRTAGAPNNRWGNITLLCGDAVGPMFRDWSASSMTVASLEFLSANQGQQLISTASPFQAEFGAIRLENCHYVSPVSLLSFPQGFVRIGYLEVSGASSVFQPSSGMISVVYTAASDKTTSNLDIGAVSCYASALSGNCVVVSGGTPQGRIRIGGSPILTGGWGLQSTVATATGNYVTVEGWVNNSLSPDIGDRDYTVTVGDPNILHFGSTFTAPRTITLPPKDGNDLCAGLYYELVFSGAINGPNVAVIRQGDSVLRTQTLDGTKLRYMWRRSGVGEWVLTETVGVGGEGIPQVQARPA